MNHPMRLRFMLSVWLKNTTQRIRRWRSTGMLASRSRAFLMLGLSASVLSLAGCTRHFWRTQADFDTYNLITLKQLFDPRWQLPRQTVEADPRSRYYDPFDLDREPLPPDDPVARQYMDWVYGMRGYRSWHKFGQLMSVENPNWLAQFEFAPDVTQRIQENLVQRDRGPDGGYVSDEEHTPEILLASAQMPARREVNLASYKDFVDGSVAAERPELPTPEADMSVVPPTPGAAPTEPLMLAPVPDEEQARDARELIDRPGQALANPDLPMDSPIQRGPILKPTIRKLSLEQALELANINSRDYQTNIENVYLSALSLTFSQFQFNVRFLGLPGTNPTGNLNYQNQPGTSSRLGFNNRFGVSQQLASGGQIIVELANNTLWLFSGGKQTTSVSTLTYQLTQPLLLGAGRKVILEGLTQAERQLIYDIRTLARFRKIFFATVTANDPNCWYNLLEVRQNIENQQSFIYELSFQLNRQRELNSSIVMFVDLAEMPVPIPEDLKGKLGYKANRKRLTWMGEMTEAEAERVLSLSPSVEYRERAQELVDRIRIGTYTQDILTLFPTLINSQNQLRQQRLNYANQVDQFKILLGLPTDIQLTLDTSFLEQFRLIDPKIREVELRVLDAVTPLGIIDDDEPDIEELENAIRVLRGLVRDLEENGIELVRTDFRRVGENSPRRLARLTDPKEREGVLRFLERDRLVFSGLLERYQREVIEELDKQEGIVRDVARIAPQTPEEVRDRNKTLGLALESLRDVREQLLETARALKTVQVGLRSELLSLTDFNLSIDDVVEIALENRLDLMNVRAQVMDARRQMEVAANKLQAGLTVVVRGDIGTPQLTNRPFQFESRDSTYQAGLQMTAPLDLYQNRNTYRQSLVTYQQKRRAYMLAEDNVKNDVRSAWRALQLFRLQFENARRSLRYSAMQLDITIANNSRAVAGAAGGNASIQLVNSLNNVVNAQNQLIAIWLNYEQARINIHRDMDIMVIDEYGRWTDPLYQRSNPIMTREDLTDPASTPPPVLISPDKGQTSDDTTEHARPLSRTGHSFPRDVIPAAGFEDGSRRAPKAVSAVGLRETADDDPDASVLADGLRGPDGRRLPKLGRRAGVVEPNQRREARPVRDGSREAWSVPSQRD